MAFKILETEKFKRDLEEALVWLYIHNLEQSSEFADRKFLELEQEIRNLKDLLKTNPKMGQTDEMISGLRRFPMYDGRYSVTWIIDNKMETILLLEFLDSKYPQNLREFHFDECQS